MVLALQGLILFLDLTTHRPSQQPNSSYLILLRQIPHNVALFRLHVLLDYTMPSTINNFLEPWQGLGADDLLHTLADSAGPSSVDRRYEELGQTEVWHALSNIISSPKISASLDITFTPWWQVWMPDLARIIYNERQLESLYYNTLITRVNIALEHAIPPEDPRITVVVCPGSFNSYDPHSSDGKETLILPDWIVIEGTYTPQDVSFPRLDQLALEGKIIAVGDTKLVRHQSKPGGVSEIFRSPGHVVDGTHSCHRGYLAQVQHYARMLRTRFGFVLTNKELVLAQFLREDEATPRLPRQRGLRSLTQSSQLQRGVPSDFRSSELWDGFDGDGGCKKPLNTSPPGQSRGRIGSCSLTPCRSRPTVTGDWRDEGGDKLPHKYNPPSSPPRPTPVIEGQAGSAAERLALTPMLHPSELPFKDFLSTSASTPAQFALTSDDPPDPLWTPPKDQLPSSSLTYAPSERDHDIGRVLVQSFRIPNPCDKDSTEKWEGCEESGRTHPAKALFALLMLAYSLEAQGRSIDGEETLFRT